MLTIKKNLWNIPLSFFVKRDFFSYPFPKRQILDSLKLKEFIDDIFEFNENGRKFFKRLENTVGKGEIGLFPHCLYSRHVKTRVCRRQF